MNIAHLCAAIVLLTCSNLLCQTTQKAVVPLRKEIPLAPCATIGNPKSCHTFNEMLVAHDPDFADLQNPTYSAYICFETELDGFFGVTWPHFEKRYYALRPEDIDSPQILNVRSYVDGQDNGTYFGMFRWNWTKGVQNTEEATIGPLAKDKQGLQSANVDSAGVSIRILYSNRKNDDITEDINIRMSTGRYTLRRTTANDLNSTNDIGKCIVYPRPPVVTAPRSR